MKMMMLLLMLTTIAAVAPVAMDGGTRDGDGADAGTATRQGGRIFWNGTTAVEGLGGEVVGLLLVLVLGCHGHGRRFSFVGVLELELHRSTYLQTCRYLRKDRERVRLLRTDRSYGAIEVLLCMTRTIDMARSKDHGDFTQLLAAYSFILHSPSPCFTITSPASSTYLHVVLIL